MQKMGRRTGRLGAPSQGRGLEACPRKLPNLPKTAGGRQSFGFSETEGHMLGPVGVGADADAAAQRAELL